MARTKPRPASKRNARKTPGPAVPHSQPWLKRRKTTTQPEEEIADDTTAKDDIRHLVTKRKVETLPGPSHNKFPPSSKSEVIDLTIDEEWHKVFGGQAWMSKNFLGEGEQNWTAPKQLSDRIRAHAQKEEQKSRDKQPKKQKRKQEKKAVAAAQSVAAAKSIVPNKSEASAIMFTIPEAIAATKKRSSARNLAYDLLTGANLSYPVKRSYHLGAMGRYGATPASYQLPYRAPRPAESKPRSYNTWSDYKKATD